MLRFLMLGYFRWREDAYRATCYATDLGGPNGQCVYMYESYELLSEDLNRNRISVHTRQVNTPQKGEWGTRDALEGIALEKTAFDGLLVTPSCLSSGDDLSLVRMYLESGRNVLLVVPEGMMMYTSNEPRKDAAARFLEGLGLDPQFALSGDRQRYQRLEVLRGVLHLATEDAVSDWAFYNGYGRNQQNDARLDLLCQQLPRHRSAHLLIMASLPEAWPCGQEFTADYRVKNCSLFPVTGVLTAVAAPSFELYSSPDVTFSLQPGEETVVSCLVHPRAVGSYCEVLSFESDPNIQLVQRGEGITIRQALLHALRKQSPHDTQELKRLADVAVRLATPRLEDDVAKTLALLSSDPESALNRVRKIAEKLCKSVIGTGASGTLNDMIRVLKDRGLMSDRAVSYLHTIRTIANLASHDSGKELTGEDVRIVAYALALVIEEILDGGGNKSTC